jgi:ribosomal protein L37E
MHTHDECSKCGSGELLRIPATPGQHSHIVLGDRVLHTVAVTKYVCAACGYIEQWVNNKDDLERLREERRRGPRVV